MDNAQIEKLFTHHAPKGDQTERYERIRAKARELAYVINECCPHSREASLAVTHLQTAAMFANAAIAINE